MLIESSIFVSEMYGNQDGTIPATFQIIYMIGWKPDPSQPKPLERGTGNVSMRDIYRLDEAVKEATQNIVKQTAKEITDPTDGKSR
jgi:NADH dehydrogenase [ubiquinone] 1 alpha subcomplex assembly factor 5